MDSIRSTLIGKKEEPSMWDELNQECSLSLQNRIIGFCICMGLGVLFSIMSMFFLPGILVNPAGFAVPYTIGNLLSLGSTFFLIGPMRQLKNMFKPTRLTAAILYVFSLAMTLWLAFSGKSALLVLLFVILQFCALTWYTLSYIPYARHCIKNCCTSLVV